MHVCEKMNHAVLPLALKDNEMDSAPRRGNILDKERSVLGTEASHVSTPDGLHYWGILSFRLLHAY